MAQAKTQPKLTFEEFLEYDDGTEKRYELVDGVPVEVPAESDLNLELAMALMGLLLPFVGSLKLFRTKSQLAVSPLAGIPNQTREADLIVLTPELATVLKGEGSSVIRSKMPNPPLVVEFVSPYERPGDENYQRDYLDKRKQYERRGIPEYWIVDATAQKVTVLTLKGKSYAEQVFTDQDRIVSAAFPALVLTAEQIFASDR
ncbi:MAG: Uma2 family endonuclease [Leptolyngbyaceae cyanobacterium]